jgi:ATP-binding cassette subfamily B protein/subfamily B ATP-binding cassette protein MsbA
MTISGVSLAVLAGSYLVIHQSTHLYGIRITNAPLQPATLLLFYAFLMGASEPLKKLAASVVTVQRTAVAVDRVGELMNREATITSPPRPLRLAAPIAVLKMENIHFAYPSGSRVIRGIDLELRAGETVAIIGPNGCGKSTLVNLIPRLYDPTQGAIRLDGVDTRQMRLRDLRSRIAIVPQETLLLDDTVFNNIRYGSFRASEEQVVAASRMAQADAFITNRLPAGYETVVGERGCFLSGGQRQRISLARALLRDPEILILDEATSEIDTRSERLIHRALRASAKNRITIVIAHGRNILEVADRVIVLDGGVVQAEGAHQDLLASSTYYGQLFESQIPEAA